MTQRRVTAALVDYGAGNLASVSRALTGLGYRCRASRDPETLARADVLVLPGDHPLARKERLTLEDIAHESLITYHPSFTGRTRIDHAFAQRKLVPRIVLEAIDSDVITTYVRLGLGIGIVAEMAMRDDPVGDLAVRPVGHLFGQSVARVAFKRGAYLRNFVYKFAGLLSDRLSRELIARAMTGHVNDYEL